MNNIPGSEAMRSSFLFQPRRENGIMSPRIEFVLALIVLFAVPAEAQNPICDRANSAQACFSALRDKNEIAHKAANTAASDSVEKGTSAKPTGSEAAIAGAQTAIKDFLPRLATALAIPGLSSDPKAVGLRFNIKPADPVWNAPFSLQMESTANQPVLYAPLLASLPAAKRSALSDSITKTLSDFSDVGLSGALNIETMSLGRSFRTHAQEISDLTGVLLRPNDVEVNTVFGQLSSTVAHLNVADSVRCGQFPNKMNMPLNCFRPADQSVAEALLGRLDKTIDEVTERSREQLKAAHFDRLDDLLSNQPQVNLTGQYHARQNEIGPREFKASLRFEYSPVNLNAVRDFCHRHGAAVLKPDCVTAYLSQDAIQRSLDRSDRLWATVDLSRTARYDFALASDSARVTKPASVALEPAAGFGSYLGFADQKAKFDVELRYRYSSNQSVRENRVVGTATLTQKISDQSSSVFTLKWANKPEFLGEVDKKLRANFGLSYKVGDKK
jgi:hypothetical protein